MTCKDLQQCSLGHLQTLFGPRTGQSLYNYCRGVDSRPVKSEHVVGLLSLINDQVYLFVMIAIPSGTSCTEYVHLFRGSLCQQR